MTAQIEQHPRSGVELSTTLPRSPLEVLAFVLCGAAMAAVLGAVVLHLPGVAAAACLLMLASFVVGFVLGACRYG